MKWFLTLVIIPALPPPPKPIPYLLGDKAQSALGEPLVLVCLWYGDHWSFPTISHQRSVQNVVELSLRV